MDISLEIVPRTIEQFEKECQIVRKNFPRVQTINVPDLLRTKIRSWETGSLINHYSFRQIPHLRAMDFDMTQEQKLIDILDQSVLDQILVIEGDKPQGLIRKIYATTSIQLIRKIKQLRPKIKVYAAFDQYRSNMRAELDYINRKIEAGAQGFFSQPFYDLRLLEIWAEKLSTTAVYWGLSPIESEKSRLYWETRNNVVFPAQFTPTLNWNISFARQVLDYCQKNHFNVYLMPIKTDIFTYLDKLFT